MTRDEWLSQFEDELKKLRPHLAPHVVATISEAAYTPADHPHVAAREYHKHMQASASPAKKR